MRDSPFIWSELKEWKEFSHNNTAEALRRSLRGPEVPLKACWQVVEVVKPETFWFSKGKCYILISHESKGKMQTSRNYESKDWFVHI